MLPILGVTFPFFALVFCGYVAARARLLPLESIPGLNAFVLVFALPCMLYRFTASTPIVRLLDPGVALTWLACALAMVAIAIAMTRRGAIGWNDASFGALVAAFPNSGFMGVPLLVALLGQAAAGPTILCNAIDMVVTSSLCLALSRLDAAGEHGALGAAFRALKGMLANPLPWAIVLGVLSSASGLQLPQTAARIVAMLADAASPTALFTIGAVLARTRARYAAGVAPRRAGLGDVAWLSACKLVLHPLLVLGIGTAAIAMGARLDPFVLAVLVLVAALPGASNVPMLAERYEADAGRIAQVVLLTTTAAFVSFPIAVRALR